MSTYRFTLLDNNGSVDFGTDKVRNWDELKPSLARSKTYKGLVSSFTNTFIFVESIRDRFVILFDKYGQKADAVLFIYAGNDNGERNSYKQIGEGQRFKANFASPKITELTFEINFDDSSFSSKFNSRDKEKINFDKLNNLDGGVMSDLKLDEIILHDRTIKLFSRLEMGGAQAGSEFRISLPFMQTGFVIDDFWTGIPINIDFKSDDNIKTVTAIASHDINNIESFLYLKSDVDRIVKLDLDFNFDITPIIFNTDGNAVEVNVGYKIKDSNFNVKKHEILSDVFNFTSINDVFNFTYKDIKNEQLTEGDSIQLYFRFVPKSPGSVKFEIRYTDTESNYITCESTEYYEQTTSKIILPHELFSRYAEFITGEKNSFYSELFGRTDLGYSEDGEWAYLVVSSGAMIRNIPFEQLPFVTTFKEVFKEYNKKVPIAMWIEQISGKQRIRVEKYEDSFEGEVIVDLGTNYNGVERSVREDSIYTGIKVGEKDHEYEEVSGLNTTNGEINMITPIESKDKNYDIVGKWRTDSEGLEFARRSQFINNTTTDTKYDKNIWLIDSYKLGGSILARRMELFQLVTGVTNPSNGYNFRLTPKRCFLRHGSIIKESLTRNENLKISYIKGASNQGLVTQLITENMPVVEKDDVNISDLSRPKILSELVNIIASMPLNDYNLLSLNKNKLITFTDISGKVLSMYIDDVKYNHPIEEAEITGIIANR